MAAFSALNYIYSAVGTFLITGPDPNPSARIIAVAIICIYILIAAFLWTFAEKLSARESEEKITVKGGNWVVRLVFTSLGLLIMTFSLSPFAQAMVELFYPDFIRREKPFIYVDLGVGTLKFLIGLAIFLTHRFDNAAAFQAAQAIEPPLED